AALLPQTHPLFDGDAVHEIHLTFAQPDYWTQLTDNFEDYDDPPYIEAEFDWGSTHLDAIGVRFKGNSSYWGYYGNKKSFKLDIDEFVVGQEIEGLDKLTLNNCYLDPSFVREKCAYELCEAAGLPTVRTNYAALYINGTYWGLYLLIEQYDQEFLESRFGAGENGNLWKGEPYGSLEYLGANESSYYDDYELKTNETANDWSGLVHLTDVLNNTPVAALPDSLHNLVDANSAMAMLALENFTVNLDSYIGRCANYYFYQRDLDGRFAFMKWDQNEAWGVFNMWNLSTTQLAQLSPYWTNPSSGEDRPLAEQLYQVPGYDAVFLGHMKRLMAGAAQPDTLVARMEELRDLIRTWVYADPYMMFTTSQFEAAMTSNIYTSGGPPPGRLIPALETMIRNRNTYLAAQIGTWTPIEGLVINELMASNSSTVADDAGDYDDWIEVANIGSFPIDLDGLGLTDHFEGVPDYVFPDTTLAPGDYLIVWADEETGEGAFHAPFKLDADGEDVYLTDGAVIIDAVTFPALASDGSWGRWPDGTGEWALLSAATPDAENENPVVPEDVVLYINEFVASNSVGIQDELGEFEDWVEIHNPGPDPVDMGGLYLTDDLTLTTQWVFPDTTLASGEFLVVWCDSDPTDGPLHTNFKLSAGGEEIGLFGRLAAGNAVIDSYAYGAQSTDVSEGRETDGASTWVTFTVPTPGASNGSSVAVPLDHEVGLRLLPCSPNPFALRTNLGFAIPGEGHVRLDLFDIRGRMIARLVDGTLAAGTHDVTWDGRDGSGVRLASGVYFSRLVFGDRVLTGRITLLR
ncbi:CotH kinase family protein, partial [bacterium]|nr:CotH kinase family protein [bacterium]